MHLSRQIQGLLALTTGMQGEVRGRDITMLPLLHSHVWAKLVHCLDCKRTSLRYAALSAGNLSQQLSHGQGKSSPRQRL